MPNKTFGEALREARRNSRDLSGGPPSQERFAELIGTMPWVGKNESLTLQTISNWENNKTKIRVDNRPLLTAIVAVVLLYKGLASIEDANQLLAFGGYAPLSDEEQTNILEWIRTQNQDIQLEVPTAEIETPQRTDVAVVADEPQLTTVPTESAGAVQRRNRRRRLFLLSAAVILLVLLGAGIYWATREPIPVNTTIVDRPGGQLSQVQFDLTTSNNLRLYLCVQAKWYRLKSEEITPNPRMLVDRTYQVTDECGYKIPVTNLQIGDVEEVSIGVADTQKILTMRLYRITRTEQGIEGGFIREITTQIPQQAPSPTP
jgi:hypothetical protein